MRQTAALLLALLVTHGAIAEEPVLGWSALLDRAKADPALDAPRTELVDHAKGLAEQPIIRRARNLAEVGTNRTWLDGRSQSLEPEIKENFALAMSDFAAARVLSDELPAMAAAYRLTGDDALRERIAVQLEEMASWAPLQRPGWSLYTRGNRLPPDGKDGNWLATGCGIRAIADTLSILPPDTMKPELVAKLHTLLEGEIAGVVNDWQTQRSWFIKQDNPSTNQWVLPTEGLVRACLLLGVDRHRDAYELGVKNLLRALDCHGEKGEFEEGFGYASFTAAALYRTAHAMAVEGDRRALDRPFLVHFPTWLVHHFQPGEMVVNCFDAGPAYQAASKAAPLLSLAAMCNGSPVARWALAQQMEGPSDDVPGLAVRAMSAVGAEAAPPLFAYYERATRVNWRDSWKTEATGVWVRGGHKLDQHDHQDRGHVNFILRGKPIFIESGTPDYSHRQMMSLFSSCIGHNVLQLGTIEPEESSLPGKHVWHEGWQKVGGVAPIAVRTLAADSGDVEVDGTACYDTVSKWSRRVAWNPSRLTVNDEVSLAEGRSDVIGFRWHLGTEAEVNIVPDADGKGARMTWPDAVVRLRANEAIAVTQSMLPDNTLAGHDGKDNPKNHHACILVRTASPVARLTLTTEAGAE